MKIMINKVQLIVAIEVIEKRMLAARIKGKEMLTTPTAKAIV